MSAIEALGFDPEAPGLRLTPGELRLVGTCFLTPFRWHVSPAVVFVLDLGINNLKMLAAVLRVSRSS